MSQPSYTCAGAARMCRADGDAPTRRRRASTLSDSSPYPSCLVVCFGHTHTLGSSVRMLFCATHFPWRPLRRGAHAAAGASSACAVPRFLRLAAGGAAGCALASAAAATAEAAGGGAAAGAAAGVAAGVAAGAAAGGATGASSAARHSASGTPRHHEDAAESAARAAASCCLGTRTKAEVESSQRSVGRSAAAVPSVALAVKILSRSSVTVEASKERWKAAAVGSASASSG